VYEVFDTRVFGQCRHYGRYPLGGADVCGNDANPPVRIAIAPRNNGPSPCLFEWGQPSADREATEIRLALDETAEYRRSNPSRTSCGTITSNVRSSAYRRIGGGGKDWTASIALGSRRGGLILSSDGEKLLSTDGDLAGGGFSGQGRVWGCLRDVRLVDGEGLLSGGDFLSAAVTDAAVTALGLIAALGDQ